MEKESITTKNRVAVYGRVSTTNQETEGTIETQLAAVREYAAKNDLTIVKEYGDQGWSGDSIIRPGLDQLRVDAKKGIWEAILAYDPDRIARRFSYQELISDELRDAGIEILYVTTSTPTNPEDRILFGVKGLFAEYERAKITERFRLGKVRKAKEGNIISSEGPYGYKFIRKSGSRADGTFRHGRYEIEGTEVSVVKDIFEWVGKEGLTLHAVVRRLQQMGVKPRKSKRGVWGTNTLSKMLRNRTYIGEGHYGASYAVVPKKPLKEAKYKKVRKTSRRARPVDEWIVIPTPRIISDELFRKVQIRLRENLKRSKRNRKNEYLLAGSIWCTCECRRTGEGSSKGKHLYYRCSNRIKRFPLPKTCKKKGINAKVADELVWRELIKLMGSPTLIQEQANRWIKSKEKAFDGSTVDVSKLDSEVSMAKAQIERLTTAYSEGVLSLESLKGHVEPIKARIQDLRSQISEAQKPTSGPQFGIPRRGDVSVFARQARKQLVSLKFEQKKAIVDLVVDRIIADQKQLTVLGHLPVSKGNDVELFSHDRDGRRLNGQVDQGEACVPFSIPIMLPPPLKTGVDYGFKMSGGGEYLDPVRPNTPA